MIETDVGETLNECLIESASRSFAFFYKKKKEKATYSNRYERLKQSDLFWVFYDKFAHVIFQNYKFACTTITIRQVCLYYSWYMTT